MPNVKNEHNTSVAKVSDRTATNMVLRLMPVIGMLGAMAACLRLRMFSFYVELYRKSRTFCLMVSMCKSGMKTSLGLGVRGRASRGSGADGTRANSSPRPCGSGKEPPRSPMLANASAALSAQNC